MCVYAGGVVLPVQKEGTMRVLLFVSTPTRRTVRCRLAECGYDGELAGFADSTFPGSGVLRFVSLEWESGYFEVEKEELERAAAVLGARALSGRVADYGELVEYLRTRGK